MGACGWFTVGSHVTWHNIRGSRRCSLWGATAYDCLGCVARRVRERLYQKLQVEDMLSVILSCTSTTAPPDH
eukprot:scaffold75398_cov20-Prasinocladus_malaysianus.AAC.1